MKNNHEYTDFVIESFKQFFLDLYSLVVLKINSGLDIRSEQTQA